MKLLLAWRNLSSSFYRFLASLLGIAMAVTLMCLQLGFRHALLDSTAVIHHALDGELFLVRSNQYTLSVSCPFPRQRLILAGSVPGVRQALAFYVEPRYLDWRHPVTGVPRRIRVLAYDPEDDLLTIPEVRSQIDALHQPDRVLADRLSRDADYGEFHDGLSSELGRQQATVVGTFSLGTDFQNHGTLIVSSSDLFRRLPYRQGSEPGRDLIDVGVLRLAPEASIEEVRRRLRATLPEDVMVFDRAEFIAHEHYFWQHVAPIGIVFDIGLAMGFLVGAMVAYQVIYSEISDHQAEFATLKAIGHSDRWLWTTISYEAAFLAILGGAVGFAISAGLFEWIGASTGLPIRLTPMGVVVIQLLTLLLCQAAGSIAARELRTLDPADLFH